jgi:hypothetical protein
MWIEKVVLHLQLDIIYYKILGWNLEILIFLSSLYSIVRWYFGSCFSNLKMIFKSITTLQICHKMCIGIIEFFFWRSYILSWIEIYILNFAKMCINGCMEQFITLVELGHHFKKKIAKPYKKTRRYVIWSSYK